MHFDTHVHSVVSPDSEMLPEEAILALAQRGMGIIFTEHVDYFPASSHTENNHPMFGCHFNVDFSLYPETYLPLRSSSVLLGLEIGLTEDYIDQNRAHALCPEFDFILGSVHWTGGWDLAFANDFYTAEGSEVYRRHLLTVRKMIELNDFFDSLAHIDYISRYTPLAEKYVRYENYPCEYDALLLALIERGRLMELNTRQLDDPEMCKNLFVIFKRYYDLGGRYVTIGSDAHFPHALACNYDKALGILKETELKPAIFKERKLIPV